jgi:NitT/TauT family transport system permease protein
MAMMWYVLFNLIGGMKSIPSELDEAAKSFRVKGWMYFTKILLPASIPSLVTGSVTAFGGGWNALIVAEYLSAGTLNYSVLGIGSLLNAEVKQGNIVLITLSVVAMSAAVLLLNAYVWKKLYAYSKKYFINA